MDLKVLLFMLLCNGPLAGVLLADSVQSHRSELRAQAAEAVGRCQAGSRWFPREGCGQPVVARLDVYEGYEYRFFKYLCDEHAREAQRRMAGAAYRVTPLTRDAA